VILYFILMTVVMTWPLLTKDEQFYCRTLGDNIYFVWMIGWFKKALFDLHVNLLTSGFELPAGCWEPGLYRNYPGADPDRAAFSLVGSPTRLITPP